MDLGRSLHVLPPPSPHPRVKGGMYVSNGSFKRMHTHLYKGEIHSSGLSDCTHHHRLHGPGHTYSSPRLNNHPPPPSTPAPRTTTYGGRAAQGHAHWQPLSPACFRVRSTPANQARMNLPLRPLAHLQLARQFPHERRASIESLPLVVEARKRPCVPTAQVVAQALCLCGGGVGRAQRVSDSIGSTSGSPAPRQEEA